MAMVLMMRPEEKKAGRGDEMIRKIYIPGLLLTIFLVVSDFSLTTLRVHIYMYTTCTNIKDNTVSH